MDDEQPIYGRHVRVPHPHNKLVHLATPVFNASTLHPSYAGSFTGHYSTCLGILTMSGPLIKGPKDWEAWIVDAPLTCMECIANDSRQRRSR